MVGPYAVPVFTCCLGSLRLGPLGRRRGDSWGKGLRAQDPKRRRWIPPLRTGLKALRREDRLLPQPQPWLPAWALPCPPTGVSTRRAEGQGLVPSTPRTMTTLQTSSPHKARHLRFLPRRHPRWSNNAEDKGRLRGARGSARVRARRAEDAPRSRRAEISPVGAHAHLSAFRATETSGRPIRASEGTEISSWKRHAETEHTQMSLPPPGAQRTVPGQDGQRSRPRVASPGGPLCAAQRKGVLGPLPQPSPAPSVSSPAPWSHTHCAPSRRSDLGVSGLRNPGPNPIPSPSLRRGRQGSRGRGSSSPALDSAPGNPEGKGRGRGARRSEPPSPGVPSGQAGLRPSLSPSHPRGQPGEAAAGRTGPAGSAQGWRLRPSGRKVGWRQAKGARAGPGLPGAGALAHLRVPGRGPGMGAAARHGRGSVRGSRHWAQAQRRGGRDPRIPRAPPPSRLRRSSRAPGLRWRRGLGLGAGSGAGPAWLGLGLGAPGWLRPRATRPGIRTWRSARSEGEHLGSRRGAHPHGPGGALPQTAAHADTGRHRRHWHTPWGTSTPTW